jgi:hypothetical protein
MSVTNCRFDVEGYTALAAAFEHIKDFGERAERKHEDDEGSGYAGVRAGA